MEKPSVKRPDFAKPDRPCYDYRNMEDAGQYRGIGQSGKIGHMNSSNSVDAMPPSSSKKKIPRDYEG